MANEAKAHNDSPVTGTRELKNFIDQTMTNRAAPDKRIKIGIVSENTKELLDNKFGFGVQDINIDKAGVIHAMGKPAHNLEPDDLLHAADVINTSRDITLSPENHQNNQMLIFKKDINGELTVLAEFRKKNDYLLVFDAWRIRKARRHPDAVQAPPGTNAQNASPHTVKSLSDTSEKKSSTLSPKQHNSGDFPDISYQLTYEGELEEAKKAVAEKRGREEFINDRLEYSAAMDDDLPYGINDEKEAREWLGKIYDEAAAGKEKPLTTTEIDELLAEDLRADNGKFQGFMQAAANAVDAKKAREIRELQKAIGETYRKGTPPEKVNSGETEYKKLSPFLQRAYDDERLGIVA